MQRQIDIDARKLRSALRKAGINPAGKVSVANNDYISELSVDACHELDDETLEACTPGAGDAYQLNPYNVAEFDEHAEYAADNHDAAEPTRENDKHATTLAKFAADCEANGTPASLHAAKGYRIELAAYLADGTIGQPDPTTY